MGLKWANFQIHENRHRINGKWVYILDDDDFIIDLKFIEKLKIIDKKISTGIIICKGYINEELFPHHGFWKRAPIRGTIGSPNFIVTKKVFLKHSIHWCQSRAGDYFFIKKAYAHEKTHWWNNCVFYAPIGLCKPEISVEIQQKYIKIQEEHDRHQNSVHA